MNLKQLLLVLALATPVAAQTTYHYPAQETNNTFAGTNTFNAAVTHNNAATLGVWALDGDSLTAGKEGIGLFVDDYGSILQSLSGLSVANYGVGGTTSTQITTKAGATNSSISAFSADIPACTTQSCTPIQVAFPIGFEPTANSTTGGGLVNATGTIQASVNIHGTVTEAAEYVGTSTWAISSGTMTINGLVLVAGSGVTLQSGTIVTVTGITGANGCSNINGPQTLTAGSSSTVSFTTTCTGTGNGGVVTVYTFTPDSYTPGATFTGVPPPVVYVPDQTCPNCSLIAWPGRNNLFTNGNYPSGLTVVENSVTALAGLVPTGKTFIILPVIPENVTAEWTSGGNYSTLTALRIWEQTTYPNNFVDVWTALQNAKTSALHTDTADVANGNIPTSLRAVIATGTVAVIMHSGDTSVQVNVTGGVLKTGLPVTLDVGNSAADENITCTTITGSSNPFTLSGCTRGFGNTTPFTHNVGAIVQEDDATHLNANGYKIVAQAIASHLGVASATASTTTPQLNRANTLGGIGVQAHTVAGGCTSGLQLVLGNTSTIQDSFGCLEASSVTGGAYYAYNAIQNGGYGVDQWHQPLGSLVSYMATLTANGWGLYHSLSAAADNPFSSFWTGPDILLARNAATFNVQAFFTSSSNTFANNADTANTVIVQCGTTADQSCTLRFSDKNGNADWDLVKPNDNSFRLFDDVNSLYRFINIPGAQSVINAAGGGAVQLNLTANSGTGGVLFGSGGASPTTVGSVNNSGKAFFNGGLQVGGGMGINAINTGTATLTYTSIAAQTCQEQTLSVVNASTTNFGVSASPNTTLGNVNLTWSAWVSAPATVSVRVCNPTPGSITPSAAVWGVTVNQ